MELRHYLSILGRRKLVIAITAVVTTLVAAVGSRMLIPQFAATAILWVPASHGAGVNSGDILLNDRLISTYIELATSGPVVDKLEQQLNIPATQIRSSVNAESIAQTELMRITVQDPNPKLAADVANGVASILIEKTRSTDAGRDLRVSLFAPAGVPEDPTWLGVLPTPFWREINTALGLVMGLVAGLALAFFFEYMDTTLYTTKQIEAATALTTLVEIPVAKKRQLNTSLNGHTLYSESFRHLRANILFDQNTHHQTLLVTSALPGEGKSTILVNLASAIAQSKHKVIVVDANLRAPALHKIFNLSDMTGLSNVLKQEVGLTDALQNSTIPGVKVVTSGPLPDDPAELLDSPLLADLIEQLKQQTDFVLIDTPAVLSATDATVLSPLVDSVMLVVEQAKAHQEAVQATCHQLSSVSSKFVGIVVNRTRQSLSK